IERVTNSDDNVRQINTARWYISRFLEADAKTWHLYLMWKHKQFDIHYKFVTKNNTESSQHEVKSIEETKSLFFGLNVTIVAVLKGKAEEIDLSVPIVDIIISEWTECIWRTCNDANAETIVKYDEVLKDEHIKPGDTAVHTILLNGLATVSPVTYFAFVSMLVSVVGDCIIPVAPIGVNIIFSNLRCMQRTLQY
nr:hypothetical protein [Tanacetum cinerariifolium]